MADYNNVDNSNHNTSNSSEGRTGNLSSLNSTNQPNNNQHADNSLLARKLRANSIIENRYKG